MGRGGGNEGQVHLKLLLEATASEFSFESSAKLSTNRKHLSEKCQPRADLCGSSKKENFMETGSADQSQTTSIHGDSRLQTHTQYAHQMEKRESNHLPCSHILLVPVSSDTLITVGRHRDFTKSAEQGKSQRVRRMNDLPWGRAHINGGLEPRAYSAVSHLGSGHGLQSSSPRPWNKWLFSSFRSHLQCPLLREVSPHNRLPFASPALHPFHFQNRTLIIPRYRLFVGGLLTAFSHQSTTPCY